MAAKKKVAKKAVKKTTKKKATKKAAKKTTKKRAQYSLFRKQKENPLSIGDFLFVLKYLNIWEY